MCLKRKAREHVATKGLDTRLNFRPPLSGSHCSSSSSYGFASPMFHVKQRTCAVRQSQHTMTQGCLVTPHTGALPYSAIGKDSTLRAFRCCHGSCGSGNRTCGCGICTLKVRALSEGLYSRKPQMDALPWAATKGKLPQIGGPGILKPNRLFLAGGIYISGRCHAGAL